MSIIFRSIFLAGLGGLILLQFSAAHRATDLFFPASGVNAVRLPGVNAWSTRIDDGGSTMLARLDVLKAEIHTDLCTHGARNYCLAGVCLTVPLDGCTRK